jgi:hypothetical protein
MAQQNSVDINVNVQGNAVESIGNVKKALKEANAELINAQGNFGDYSQEAIAAAKKVAELKDRISEARETADLFDPGKKFQALAGAVTAVAGGFTAVQGALGLLGIESESVEKTLLKVQSALALSQGLSTITDAAKDFKRFGTIASGAFDSIKKGAANAFKSIKAGLASTGIGLLVIALGSIVAYWDDIKELVNGVSSEQEELNKLAQENLETQEEKLDAIDGQSNQLKLQGKSEREILGLKIKQTDEAIKAAEVNIANAKATKDAQIQATQRNREILLGVINFISTPIKYILGAVDDIGKALGKNFGLVASQQKANQMMANYVFDPAETAKEGDKTIKEAEATLNKLKEKRAGSILALQNLDKQAAATAKSEADKRAEEESARIEKQLAEEKKLTEDLLAEYEKRRNAANNAKTLSQKELAALDEQERLQQIDANNKKFDAQIAGLSKITNYTYENISKDQQLKEDARKAEIQADIVLEDEKFKIAQSGISLLSSLAGQNEKIANAIFVIDKAMAIAKIVVDTQREIAGYYAANSVFGPAGLVIATKQALFAKVRAGIGIASIAGTTIAKFKGGGSAGGALGGAAGGSAPSVSAQAPLEPPQPQTTTLSNQTINAIGNQAIRSYVVESDVTSNQQRIAAIQQRARFG